MMKMIKELGTWLIIGVAGAVVVLAVIYIFRLFMNTTAPITVHEVEEGIRCAISSGGEAIDCWKI